MSDLQDPFGKSVLQCADDMGRIWPALRLRYDRLVVVCAMAEQVGAALRTLLRRKICDVADARRFISRIESRALRMHPGGDTRHRRA